MQRCGSVTHLQVQTTCGEMPFLMSVNRRLLFAGVITTRFVVILSKQDYAFPNVDATIEMEARDRGRSDRGMEEDQSEGGNSGHPSMN